MGLEEAVSFDGPYAAFLNALQQHLITVLQPGKCLFPDGSWRLSEHSENSWISKVFLCQFIARQILKVDLGKDGQKHDQVHANWWRVGSPSNPGIDQIFSGKTYETGFFYPRAVTCILWLEERTPITI